MYTVEKEELLYDGKSLGSKDEIYVDGRQDVAGYVKKSSRKGFTVAKLTEGDYDNSQISWSPDCSSLAFISARHEDRDRDPIEDLWLLTITVSYTHLTLPTILLV